MPGINLLDFTRADQIVADQRHELVVMIHDVLLDFTGKRPKHTSFVYSPANYLDASIVDDGEMALRTDGFDCILVVDGEKNKKTKKSKHEIRETFKKMAAPILNTTPEKLAVRYRLHDSSFG
jgi:hypothetical protein